MYLMETAALSINCKGIVEAGESIGAIVQMGKLRLTDFIILAKLCSYEG